MKQHAKKIVAIVIALIVVVICVIFGVSSCNGGPSGPAASGGNQSSGTGSVPVDEKGTATYTVELESAGGMALSEVGVYVYTDETLAELVWFERTDEFGMMSFTDAVSDSYVAVLQGLPVGYAVEEYYPITGEETKITLYGALTPYEEAGEFTYGLGSMVYDFTVTAPDGTEYNLAQLLQEKKLIILNFWYTTCDPCRSEFPAIQAVSEQYAEDAIVLCMNPVDGSDESIKALMKELELTLPMAGCGSEWEAMMGIYAYPTTVVIDRYGMISMMHTGAVTNPEVWEAIFAHYTSDEYEQAIYADISLLAEGLDLEGELEEGSEANPFELGGQSSFEVTVPAGEVVYYDLYKAFDMILQVKGDADTYVIYNGKTYQANSSGVISLTVNCADAFSPAKVGFGNGGKEEITVKATLSSKAGSIDRPYAMSLGEFTTNVSAGNDQGVYYTWTAPDSGTLTLQNVSCTSGVEHGYTLYNLRSYAQRTLQGDGVVDENGITTVSINVSKGDVVQVIVGVLPDKAYNYPAATITTLATFQAGENPDTLYPYVVTVVDDEGTPLAGVSLTVNGFAYTTDAKGQITVELKKGEWNAVVTLPNGYTADALEHPFEVKGDAEADALTLTLNKLYKYTVTVTDVEGNPLVCAAVKVGELTALTDANGTASLRMPDGAYTVDVTAEGYATVNAVSFGSERTAEIKMNAQPVSYTITVVDEAGDPVKGAMLLIERQSAVMEAGTNVTIPAISAESGEDGKITYETYLADHKVSVDCVGYYTDAYTVDDQTMTITLLLPQTYTIEVVDDNGTGVQGVSVTVRDTSGLTDDTFGGSSGADGYITFTAPAAGSYVAKVDVTTLPEGLAFSSEELPIQSNTLVIRLYRCSNYTVQVVDQNGAPVAGATIDFVGTLAGKEANATYTTDSTGKVNFIGDEADYTRVTINLPQGYVLAEGESATKYFGSGSTVVYDLTFKLQEVIDYTITLTDYAGNPLSDTTGITLRFNGNEAALTNGAYSAQMMAGDYAVTLSSDGKYVLSVTEATLTAAQPSLTVKAAKASADKNTFYNFLGEEGGNVPVYSAGSYAVTVTPGAENYFAIDMSSSKNAAGIYELSFDGAGDDKVYYRGNNFFQNSDTGATNAQGVCTTKLTSGTEIFFCVLADEDTTQGVLTIVYKGAEETVTRQDYTGTHTPSAYHLPEGAVLTQPDITKGADYVLVKDANGFYHLDSETGPLLLVDLNWTPLSLSSLVANGPLVSYVDGNGDGKYENAVDLRVDYTACLNGYIECAATQAIDAVAYHLVYPLTDDLMDMLQQAGSFRGWWNPTSPEYLPYFDDVGDYDQAYGWMSFLVSLQ